MEALTDQAKVLAVAASAGIVEVRPCRCKPTGRVMRQTSSSARAHVHPNPAYLHAPLKGRGGGGLLGKIKSEAL